MIPPFSVRDRVTFRLTILLVLLLPFASTAWAQTPDAPTEPPVVATEVPTQAPPPPPPVETPTEALPPVKEAPVQTLPPVTPTEVATQPPATQVEVTPTEAVAAPTPTEVSTETVAPAAPATPEPTPTATNEVIVPDQLTIVSASAVTIGPGEVRDVTVRYTLGSDREKTELAVNLKAPGGDSLEGWTIAPVNRADTLEDPNDANRTFKARVDIADLVKSGDSVDTTWRLTAPAHIESPITINLDFNGKIHRTDGVTDGAIKLNLATVSAVASVHAPTVNCVAGESNTWNCTFNTTHPDSIGINVSANAPDGWEMALNSAVLADTAVTLDNATRSFSLQGTYPVGCPDANATAHTTLSVAFAYPSGDVTTISQDLTLIFKRPNPTLTVASFSFNDINQRENLDTTGTLSIDYTNVPCAWQATLELGDFQSDSLTSLDAIISIVSVAGLPDATVTMSGKSISIIAPESKTESASGEITITLAVAFPNQVLPGVYTIGVITQIVWVDET